MFFGYYLPILSTSSGWRYVSACCHSCTVGHQSSKLNAHRILCPSGTTWDFSIFWSASSRYFMEGAGSTSGSEENDLNMSIELKVKPATQTPHKKLYKEFIFWLKGKVGNTFIHLCQTSMTSPSFRLFLCSIQS